VQLFLKEPADEPALLARLDQLLSPFDTVVTYNGKAFDIPLLNTRHVLNAFQTPFGEFHHIDLLALARRIWKNRLPSRSLGTVESEILGVARGQEEIPGWMVPEIYFEYLKTGDARPLSGVFYHNRMDILSLGGLFKYGAKLLSQPMNHISQEGLDLIAVARLYEELGITSVALELYEHSLGLGLPKPFFVQTIYRYAHIAKKQGDWERAIVLWEKAALQDEVDACIEIAKYHEHINRDMDSALDWTIRAFENLQRSSLPHYVHIQYARLLEHRKDRIIRKKKTGQLP
jgi:tetratricopeptide (TPR) repeat protein